MSGLAVLVAVSGVCVVCLSRGGGICRYRIGGGGPVVDSLFGMGGRGIFT